MKAPFVSTWALIASVVSGFAQTSADESQYAVVSRDAHTRVWERTEYEIRPDGKQVPNVHRVIETATGLNVWNADTGQWEDSNPTIQQVPGGAVGIGGQHKVIFAANLATFGAIDMETPDGQRLQSHVLGLSYFDRESGRSVLIAETTNCVGQIVSSNQVEYFDAFDGLSASVRYTYTRDSFEQDIVLEENPAPPEDYGLNSSSTVLQVLTEFLSPPQPRVVMDFVSVSPGVQVADQTLHFKAMKIGHGRAFLMGNESNGVPVTKQWLQLEGRQFLVEEIPVRQIKKQLQNLPGPTASIKRGLMLNVVSAKRLLPSPPLAREGTNEMHIAENHGRNAGFVLDYITQNTSQTNFTFQSDHTYYLSGNVSLYGTNVTFEGGTVLKYGSNISLSVNCPITWQATNYFPVAIAAKDDNTIGENITGSTGNPANNYYASRAIYFESTVTGSVNVHNLKISNARNAIVINGGNGHVLSDIQLVKCGNGVAATNAEFFLKNGLLDRVLTNFNGLAATGHIEHLTSDGAAWLNQAGVNLFLTNSLLVNVTNVGGCATQCVVSLTGTNGIFQSGLGGTHYLVTNSVFHNAGTTSISPDLLLSFANKTTFAPIVLTNLTVTNNIGLSPQVPRNTGVPDIGYHYDALDYLINDFTILNATLTVSAGTQVGVYMTAAKNYGIQVRDGATFVCRGSALNMNRILRNNAVQEQSITSWISVGSLINIPTAFPYQTNSLQFTVLSIMGAPAVYTVNQNCGFTSLEDCQISGGALRAQYATMVLTNVLLERVASSFALNNSNVFGSSYIRNALFFKGTFLGSGYLDVFNTCFYKLNVSGGIVGDNGNNGYVNGFAHLNFSLGGDVFVDDVGFQAGSLGRYYLPSNSPLIDAGMGDASQAHLFNFTTQTNQVEEASSTVDIGFHYTALDGNGAILDADCDGLPDWWEWQNFGDFAHSGSDTDSTGNTLLYDFQNGIDPQHPRRDVGILGRWHFDATNWLGEQGQIPLTNVNVQLVSGVNSNAIQITNIASDLRYNIVESNGHTNLILTNGTVRFWFRPNWSSVTEGGTGPESWANLIAALPNDGYWELYFDPDGNTIWFDSSDGITWTEELGTSISWRSNEWHQIVVSYSETNMALFLDGSAVPLIDGGPLSGVTSFPEADQFIVGNPPWHNLADGVFDELETYSYPLDKTAISNDFSNSLFTPPIIRHQPASVSVVAGNSAAIAVAAAGTPSLKFQWYKNGVALAGETNATLFFSNVSGAQIGEYAVLISNAVASVSSVSAWLTLADDDAADGLLARWHFDHSERLGEQGQKPVLNNSVNLVPGITGNGCQTHPFQGPPPQSQLQYRLVEANGITNLNPQVGTICFWFGPDWTSAAGGGSGCGTLSGLFQIGSPDTGTHWELLIPPDGNTIVFYSGSGYSSGTSDDWIHYSITWTSNEWHRLVFAYDLDSTKLYMDGVLAAEGPGMGAVTTDYQFSIGSGMYPISGRFDELETFDRPLTDAEIAADVSRYSANPPSILTQPQDETGVALGIARFSVVAAGGAPLSYQWYFNTNTPIAGATSAHLALENVQSTNDGTYDVVVTNNFGAVTSSIVTLTVIPGISITNPVDNASFNASRINVQGTFTGTETRQVTVNGVLAFLGSNTFDAVNVPLDAGTNTIIAVAEDWEGNTNIASITVIGLTNADGTMNEPVQLQATPIAGFSPLQVTFTIQTNLPGTIQQVLYDFNGDDVIDLVTNNISSLTYTYATNGEYFPVVTIQTTAGRFSSSGGWNSSDPNRLRINVQAPPQILATISITDPVDIKWTATSNLYVLSGSTATITEFDSSTNVIRTLSGIGSNPSGLDVDAAGNVYVAMTGDNKVWKFLPTNSTFQADTSFGTSGFIGLSSGASGTNNGEFNAPYDVAVSPDGGTISVSDSGNNRIQQFSTNGTFAGSFGSTGSDIGQFNVPKGLAYDISGTLYIVDSGNSRVALAEGDTVEEITGTNGAALGTVNEPRNVNAANRGIYIADAGNNRIQSFDIPAAHLPFSIDASTIRFSISTNLSGPLSVAATGDLLNERLYVADTGNNRIVLYGLTSEDPIPTWAAVTNRVNGGDISGALNYFSDRTVADYRNLFSTVGNSETISTIEEIGVLTPETITDHTAEYSYADTFGGQPITGFIKFVKENGVWKILEF